MSKSICRFVAFFATLVLCLTANTKLRAEDEIDKSLAALKSELPQIFKRAEFPTLIVEGRRVPDEPFFRLVSVNRIEEKRVKLTFGTFLDASQKEPSTVIVLYLVNYKDKWTVYKHESSSYFENGDGRDKKLVLIALIDSRQ